MKHDPVAAKKRAKEQFESWAHTYDGSILNHLLFRPSYNTFMEELAKWQGQHDRQFDLLDIGCGTGTLSDMVAVSNLRARYIVGMDYAMQMCLQAHAKAELAQFELSARFINGDSEHLPFANESFDVITCGNSFHHYPHQQAAVHEMRRLLRPGGRLMIIDGFRDNVIGWFVFDVVVAAVEKTVHHAPWTTMRRYFEEAGFRDIDQRKFNIIPPILATMGST